MSRWTSSCSRNRGGFVTSDGTSNLNTAEGYPRFCGVDPRAQVSCQGSFCDRPRTDDCPRDRRAALVVLPGRIPGGDAELFDTLPGDGVGNRCPHAQSKDPCRWFRVVDAGDSRYENLFVTSADVRVDEVFVGIGTWASNFGNFGPGRFLGWRDEARQDYSMVPVNDLAARVSTGAGGLRSPGNIRATAFSRGCVPHG